jgi:predicted nucleic acid-binding protein
LVTEAILIEVGNALSSVNRLAAVQFIEQCYQIPNINVIPLTTELLKRSLQLYHSRLDKTWGLCDCISFMVMWDNNLIDVVTADQHFVQAGFRILM